MYIMETLSIKNPLDIAHTLFAPGGGGNGGPRNNKALLFIALGSLLVASISARRGRSIF